MPGQLSRTKQSTRSLALVQGQGCGRADLEAFVRELFWRCHQARPTELLDELLGIADADGRLIGVGGLTLAATDAPLFLETYLDAPIERRLSEAAGLPVARHDLAEIGNLAVQRRGAGAWMMAVLAAHARGCGREWGVFTATAPLRRLFEHLDAPLLVMDSADPARLERGDAERWGSYYDTDPRVCAAPTVAFVEAARGRWPELGPLWLRAFLAADGPQAARAA
jgi:hypothetical protein